MKWFSLQKGGIIVIFLYGTTKALSTRICFSYFPGLAYRPHLSGKNGHRKRIFSKALSSVEILENAGFSFTCGRTKTEVFQYDDAREDKGDRERIPHTNPIP